MSDSSSKSHRPLPVEGMEYWGMEAQVRFMQIKNWCSEYEIDVSVGIGTWNGILSGSLHFYTYDDATEDTYLRGKTHLCVGDYDIEKDRAKCYYLRVNRIVGDLDEHPRVMPGSSMRPAHNGDAVAGQASEMSDFTPAPPMTSGDDSSLLSIPGMTAATTTTTMTDSGSSACDTGFSGGGFSDFGGGMGCS